MYSQSYTYMYIYPCFHIHIYIYNSSIQNNQNIVNLIDYQYKYLITKYTTLLTYDEISFSFVTHKMICLQIYYNVEPIIQKILNSSKQNNIYFCFHIHITIRMYILVFTFISSFSLKSKVFLCRRKSTQPRSMSRKNSKKRQSRDFLNRVSAQSGILLR